MFSEDAIAREDVMEKNKVDISVVMACRNSSEHVEEALLSILNQSIKTIELIIVDDGSTDDTLEIAQRYQSSDDRIKVISLPTSFGPAVARNAGINSARGRWIGILDSDDIALPSRFAEQLKLGDSGNNLVLIGSNSTSVDQHGQIIRCHRYPTSHNTLIDRLYRLGGFPPHSSMIYRASILRSVNSFNSRYVRSQDWDLWLRLSEKGNIASVDAPLVKIRKHQSNISNENGGAIQQQFAVIATTCHFLRELVGIDPSVEYDNVEWSRFVDWVSCSSAAKSFYLRQGAWTNAREKYIYSGGRLYGFHRFAIELMKSEHLPQIILEKLFGSSVPLRLANEWAAKLEKTL